MTTAAATPTPEPAARTKRRRRVGCQVVLLVVLALGVIGLLLSYRLWKRTPVYWTRNQQFLQTTDNATRLEMAEALEMRMVAELTDPGHDGTTTDNFNQPRTIRVTMNELNAWLNLKLPTWASNQNVSLPPQLSGYMLATEGQDLVLAFRCRTAEIDQVFSAVVRLDLLDDGSARLVLQRLRGGELPLPAGPLAGVIQRYNPSGHAMEQVQAAIDGMTFTPVRDIDPARRLRLLGYRLHPDGAELTVQTEPRDRSK